MDEGQQPNITLADIDKAPSGLGVPSGFDFVAEYHALTTRFSSVSDQLFASKEENSTLRTRGATSATLDELIKPYARRSFWYMCAYSAFVAVVLIADGFKVWAFNLPDQVLNFLVGSTAVTVIGLVGMVLTGIFVGARPK